MTDRRRNLFILLLVAGLLVASLAVILTKPTRLGLDLKGGVSLIYQAKPTKQSAVTGDAIDRSLDIMRKRVDQIGVAEPSLQRSGADQIDVSLPDVKNADEAASQVGTTAQMWFYDWEGSVLGADCKTDPQNAQVTGGSSAGVASIPPAISLFDAVTRGAKCPRDEHGQGVVGRQVLPRRQGAQEGPRPGPTRACATCRRRRSTRRSPSTPSRSSRSRRASSSCAPSRTTPTASRRRPGTCSRTSRSSAAPTSRTPSRTTTAARGRAASPTSLFDFTDHGADVWEKFTRKLSQRGQEFSLGGQGDASNQHFAITLDNELISVPQIDWHQYPDGIDDGNGSRDLGRLHDRVRPAPGQPAEDRRPADQARAHLGRRRSRPRWASRRSTRASSPASRASSSSPSSCSIFYRVLGVIAVGALARLRDLLLRADQARSRSR